MRTTTPASRGKKNAAPAADGLGAQLAQRIIGQSAAMSEIVPYVEMYQAGLAPEGRPAGVFLLLGPTGTGKTRTVEALAEVLHGSPKAILKVDCGEFQMEHEVAKLIGAPPGYLGHRETQPMLTQQKLNSVTSDRTDLAIVLFDEIEKAAASLSRLLLGILDKAVLRLGDNTTVNFERTLIFLTSNLGAGEMTRELHPDFGFRGMVPVDTTAANRKLESIAVAAAKRKFSPEFLNRVDVISTYRPLSQEALGVILDLQLSELQEHIDERLGERAFAVDLTPETREFLLRKGTSREYGARELKRTLHRSLTQPLASMVARGEIEPGGRIRVEVNKKSNSLALKAAA